MHKMHINARRRVEKIPKSIRSNRDIKLILIALLAYFWINIAYASRIVVISDLNGSYGSVTYHSAVDRSIQRILQLQPDLVISTGDMVAGQRIRSLLVREEIEEMWQAFHHKVTKPIQAAGINFAVTPGNHDGSAYRRYHLERKIYAEQWGNRKPEVQFLDDTYYPFYYAFQIQDTLLISLDATTPGALDEKQKNWLEQLLDNEGNSYTHKIIFSHVPLWPFSQERITEALFDAELETLLKRHNVDIYLSGHHHAYYPGYKDGVRYVSQACLGASPRRLIGDRIKSERSITVINIPASGRISVEAYRAPNFDDPIPLETLPEKIVSPQAMLLREDIGFYRDQPVMK